MVLHLCSGIKRNLVKCKENLCFYLVCGCCSLVASGLTCWLVSETISTFNLSIDREEAVVFVQPTQDSLSSHIRGIGQFNSLAYKHTKTQQIPRTSTHQLKNLNCYLLFYNVALIFVPF